MTQARAERNPNALMSLLLAAQFIALLQGPVAQFIALLQGPVVQSPIKVILD